jgi:hypothetical protein
MIGETGIEILRKIAEWKLGAPGFLIALLFTYDWKTKDTKFTAIGLTALALLLAQ